jgi:hypothetical protein
VINSKEWDENGEIHLEKERKKQKRDRVKEIKLHLK